MVVVTHQYERMSLEQEALGQFGQQPEEPATVEVAAEDQITPPFARLMT
jgi:hypothetical protein